MARRRRERCFVAVVAGVPVRVRGDPARLSAAEARAALEALVAAALRRRGDGSGPCTRCRAPDHACGACPFRATGRCSWCSADRPGHLVGCPWGPPTTLERAG